MFELTFVKPILARVSTFGIAPGLVEGANYMVLRTGSASPKKYSHSFCSVNSYQEQSEFLSSEQLLGTVGVPKFVQVIDNGAKPK